MTRSLVDPRHDSYRTRKAAVGAWFAVAFGLGCGTGAEGASHSNMAPPHASDAADVATEDTGDVAETDAAIGDDAAEMDATGLGTDGSSPNCRRQSGPAPAGAARSAGFTGTDNDYFKLYSTTCRTVSDCAIACVAAGGTVSSCSAASDCLGTDDSGPKQCLPPTYWLYPGAALSESGMTTAAAELTLVDITYRDALVVTDFGLTVPDDATILGIRFDVDRNADNGQAVDDTVQAIRANLAAGPNRSQTAAWPQTLTSATYGGASDTWGLSWQPADVRAKGFGVSITPRYSGPIAGNDRAQIDSVRATVFYTAPCD